MCGELVRRERKPEWNGCGVVALYPSPLGWPFLKGWSGCVPPHDLPVEEAASWTQASRAAQRRCARVAELGGAFLCADLAISMEPRPDHAHYIADWLRVLNRDKHAIFTAASKAEQAVRFLTEHQWQPAAPMALAA